MPDFSSKPNWGTTPWAIDFRPMRHAVPDDIDFAVVGGGFSGLAAAAWFRRIAASKSVALFESSVIGAGASGHTGGMILAESAAGDLPGLGDVLAGYTATLKELAVDGDLALPGVWEIARSGGLAESPISWTDSGTLRALKEVAGGTINPGKVVSGLARAAETHGAHIFENARVSGIEFPPGLNGPVQLNVLGRKVLAKKVLLATNAMSLELSDLVGHAEPKFTLAIATEPLSSAQIADLGLASEKAFYTVDFPYLWGRLLRNGGVIFGAGLVHLVHWQEFADLNIEAGQAAELVAFLENRVRGMHPVLRNVQFTHRWGGPILIADHWRPVFARHPRSPNAIVLGAFSGHGVAQSVYLGRWAAEALCGLRGLPNWNPMDEKQ